MKLVDLVGVRFGKLVVVRNTGSSRGGSKLWECLCDCGNRYEASTRHLNRKQNNVRSCGCMKSVEGPTGKCWTGVGEISNGWWTSHIKRSCALSKRKAMGITITMQQAWDLFLLQDRKCKFTGVELIFSNTGCRNTASLDRIDNTLGYDLGNVQWVHKEINMMKRTHTSEYFIELCGKVTKYRGIYG